MVPDLIILSVIQWSDYAIKLTHCIWWCCICYTDDSIISELIVLNMTHCVWSLLSDLTMHTIYRPSWIWYIVSNNTLTDTLICFSVCARLCPKTLICSKAAESDTLYLLYCIWSDTLSADAESDTLCLLLYILDLVRCWIRHTVSDLILL